MKRILPDPKDAAIVSGLSMLFAGLWWVHPPSALIVVGSVISSVGLWGAR